MLLLDLLMAKLVILVKLAMQVMQVIKLVIKGAILVKELE